MPKTIRKGLVNIRKNTTKERSLKTKTTYKGNNMEVFAKIMDKINILESILLDKKVNSVVDHMLVLGEVRETWKEKESYVEIRWG